MSTYINYGMMLYGEEVLEKTIDLGSFLLRAYYVFSIIAIVCVVTYIVVHKSVKLYQKHLSNYLAKVKDYKKAYQEENSLSKRKKYLSQYSKNLENLRKEIKRIMFWNGKKLFITSDLLNDKTDLSIDGKTSFTFKDMLDNYVANNNKTKIKILEAISGKKQATKIKNVSVEKVEEVKGDFYTSAENTTKYERSYEQVLNELNNNNNNNNKTNKSEKNTSLNRIFVSEDDEMVK